MNNKGLGTGLAIVLLFVGVVFAGAIGYFASQALQPAVITPAVEYDGEFQDGGIPDDTTGTDLQEEVAYAESDDNASMTLNTTSRIDSNMTTGATEYWAYMFKIDDPVEDFEIDGTFDPDSDLTATATDNYDLKAAYILLDDDDYSVTDEDDALYKGTIDTDDEDFEFDISVLPKGQYVVVLKVKLVDPQDGDLDATFYGIDMEFDGGDRDLLELTIENGN